LHTYQKTASSCHHSDFSGALVEEWASETSNWKGFVADAVDSCSSSSQRAYRSASVDICGAETWNDCASPTESAVTSCDVLQAVGYGCP
jgi:hypothetical protein